jgi:hypothetical protein
MFGIDVGATAAKLGVDNLWKTVQSFTAGLVVPKTVGTGIKVDTANPTFGWADMTGAIDRAIAGGGSPPVWSAYKGNIYQYSFGTAAGVIEVFVNFHMSHDFVPDSDFYIHSHWSTAGSPTGQANWLFEAVASAGYGRDVFEGTDGSGASVTVGASGAPGGAFSHMISETLLATAGGLVVAGGNVSIASGSGVLTSASTPWTADDISKTVRVLGAGVAGAPLDTSISAYTSSSQVTLASVASTTIVAQPNFRWRILDSTHILEPDAVLLVRCWRDSARAADTLNVAPYLHFVDCHYQSNGVFGTKNRSYPFYT